MTRTTTARIAGITFLVYIAAGIASMVLFARATSGEGIAVQLAGIAQHATAVRITVVLGLLMNFSALVLAVTLYAITREQDRDLAMLALTCRVAEGVAGMGTETLGLLWLATGPGADVPDTGAAQTLGAYLLRPGFGPSATFFALGSTIFSWLLLRGRMIPSPLAWLGVVASVLLVVILPLELAGLVGGRLEWLGAVNRIKWFPMLVFEVALAAWLIFKGATAPAPRHGKLKGFSV